MSRELHIDDALVAIGNGLFQRRIFWAAGLGFAADAIEVLLISLLSIVLKSHWQLTEQHTSILISSVFGGALLGTLLLGPLGDKMGRRLVFRVTALLIAVFGILTALCHNFWTLIVCRFTVGFGVGGLTVVFDTLAEFLPNSVRGTDLLFIEFYWTGGTILTCILAYTSLGTNSVDDGSDWRWFVGLCAIPCILSAISGVLYVPESPRWLVSRRRHEEALHILREAAKINGVSTDFLRGVKVVGEHQEEGSFADLLRPRWMSTTLKLWLVWAGFAFTYYGTILAVTVAFSGGDDENLQEDDNGNYYFDYAAIFTSASSEIVGTTFVILLIDRWGRIPAQTVSYVGGGIAMFVFCFLVRTEVTVSRFLLVFMSFLARMFFMGGSCSTWVSTAEILPTEIRTTGHGASNAVARLSGALTPYLINSSTDFRIIGVIMMLTSFVTAYVCSYLPETKGVAMGAALEVADTLSGGEREQKPSEDSHGDYEML